MREKPNDIKGGDRTKIKTKAHGANRHGNRSTCGGGICDKWASYDCSRACYESESCSFTAPTHYLFPPSISNISHMRTWGNVSDFSTVYTSGCEPSLMKTQEDFCGLFYLYDLCALRVSWRVCRPPGSILKHCGRRRPSKHLWKISKHPNNKKDAGTALLIRLRAKTRVRRGREKYFYPEKCWDVILRSLMHIRTGRAFLLFP